MGLKHVVITMVARDDLPDGGAGMIAETIRQIRLANPGTSIEVLISDLNGREADIRTVVEAQPEILNHNVETVPRLQRPVRRRARWDRSVGVLTTGRRIADEIGHDTMVTKTGMMLGLGETWDEVLEAMRLLRAAEIEVLTLGQYLRPSRQHLPLQRYYTPTEFVSLRRIVQCLYPDSLETRFQLAWTLTTQGRWAEAEATVRELLQTRRRVLGSDHPATLETLHALAQRNNQSRYSAYSRESW